MKVAPDKNEAVLFEKASMLRSSPVFRIGSDRVRINNSMRYLGVIIYCKLSWIPHVDRLRTKMIGLYRALGPFKTKRVLTYGLPSALVRMWYQVVGERLLCYSSLCRAHHLNVHTIRKLRSD